LEERSAFIFRAETQANSASCFGEQRVDGNEVLGGIFVKISGSYREIEIRSKEGTTKDEGQRL
jgi:hypothetical protein